MNTHTHHHRPVNPWLLLSKDWAVSIVSSLKLPRGWVSPPWKACRGPGEGGSTADASWSTWGRRFSLSYDFSFMGKWPSAVSFQALEKCLIVFLGAPLTGQRTAKRTPPHVSRRKGTGSPRTALCWGRFGISFHTTALAATPQLPILLFPEAKGRRKMQTFPRKI